MDYANDRVAVSEGAFYPPAPTRRRRLRRAERTRPVASSSVTVGNRECKVQVHVLTRVCTYRRTNRSCTCTKRTQAPPLTVNSEALRSGNDRAVIRSDRLRPMAGEQISRNACDAHPRPWADPITGTLGRQVLTARLRDGLPRIRGTDAASRDLTDG